MVVYFSKMAATKIGPTHDAAHSLAVVSRVTPDYDRHAVANFFDVRIFRGKWSLGVPCELSEHNPLA